MKKLVVLGMGVCLVLAFASCKSSESAYKKAYEKAKQQELAEPQVEAPVEVTPVVAVPVTTTKVADTSGVRQEKVTVVSGNEGLKDYSVVAGSFGVKANAEGLKDWLDGHSLSLQQKLRWTEARDTHLPSQRSALSCHLPWQSHQHT